MKKAGMANSVAENDGGELRYSDTPVLSRSCTPVPPTPPLRHILFYEPQCGGHRAEFVGYLLQYLAENGEQFQGWRFTFAVSEDLLCEHRALALLADKLETVALLPVRTSTSWCQCRNVVDTVKPSHLMLMELTSFELALCFARLPCRVSGILFVQYPELCSGTWKQRIKLWIKDLKTRLFLRNPAIHRIFLLNGEFSCAYLNARFRTYRYVPIPDPLLPGNPDVDFQLRERYDLDTDIRIFLFFGSISKRKGAEVLFRALKRIRGETCKKSAFLILGRPEESYATRCAKQVEKLRFIRPDLRLIFDNRFFDEPSMKAVFQQSDWILMPYLRSEYSSGILAHAASFSTPVIAPDSGLLGRLVSENKLGVCSAVTPERLAKCIDEVCSTSHVFDEPKRQNFIRKSSLVDFACIIMDTFQRDGVKAMEGDP